MGQVFESHNGWVGFWMLGIFGALICGVRGADGGGGLIGAAIGLVFFGAIGYAVGRGMKPGDSSEHKPGIGEPSSTIDPDDWGSH